ncbi:hypothetical protein NKI31_28090 [Mesorhizobium sp. M0659]|uniref:hypothetical protein n=1 Tax=Mesorhizobium sp. M0659 TaxID=2956980 RepID=UPI003338B2E0
MIVRDFYEEKLTARRVENVELGSGRLLPQEPWDGPIFEIDLGKLAQEARYDGIFVLRTNARITPQQAVLRCPNFCR